jgi:hypothetical protein
METQPLIIDSQETVSSQKPNSPEKVKLPVVLPRSKKFEEPIDDFSDEERGVNRKVFKPISKKKGWFLKRNIHLKY